MTETTTTRQVDLPGLRDPRFLLSELSGWLRTRFEKTSSGGFVFGLSGGIDSAVVCGVAKHAVGEERCLGVIMPIGNPDNDAELARQAADAFSVRTVEVELTEAFDDLSATLHRAGSAVMEQMGRHAAEKAALGNLKARLRMSALYYYANLLDYLVLGTGNRAELTVGYFTKHGDGGVDLLPLGDLVKHEVRALAVHIGVPREIVERPPTAGLWEGQTDEAELGFSYEALDRYLLTGSSGSDEIDYRIRKLHQGSAHKRDTLPMARPDRG